MPWDRWMAMEAIGVIGDQKYEKTIQYYVFFTFVALTGLIYLYEILNAESASENQHRLYSLKINFTPTLKGG